MGSETIALLSICLSACVAFNVDTSFPLLKTVEGKSLFGFSVALHEDLETGDYLLLVGAPREKAESNVPANRTGGVYTCPVTAKQSDCRRIKLIDPSNLTPSEDLVEDMWLGVSVASQGRPGGRILACGHRFIKVHLGQRWMTGHCYLHRNAQHQEEDLNWQNIQQQHCDYRLDHLKEGMCTFGISASITQSDVILGSPGSYEWQGFNSFRFNSSDRISEAPSVLDKNLRAHVNPVSWMTLMGNVQAFWMNPNVTYDWKRNFFEKKDASRRNIYLGYSVTQAYHLLSAKDQTIVAGAPRDNKMDARGSVMLIVKESTDLVIQKTLRGQQVGSYFGNAVVAVDLNSDGWNDLLVGAPFYFNRQLEVGGAVYIYMNGGGRFPSEPSMVLTGPAGSAFGMAIAAAGDLDQDGFQDFAVGAPFHDAGLVMIWTGSKEGVSAEPSQVIHGSTVFPGFRTFGYSLAAGLDVDGNDYPDLLVGSLDDKIVLLRSRPVVQLNNTLRVSPDIVDPKDCIFCIQVEVCFFFKVHAGKNLNIISVNLTVSADVTSLMPRLRFQNNGESMFSSILSVRNGKCKTLRVGLLSNIRNVVEPLVFSTSVSLDLNLPKRSNTVQDLRRFPVLSQKPQPTRTQIHFQKACGSDNVCQSNLHMVAQFTDENHEPFPKHNSSQLLNYTISIRRLLLEVNVSNIASRGRLAEDAHDTVLNVSIPTSLIYSGVQASDDGALSGAVVCTVEGDTLLCPLGNPFRSNQKVQVFIKFEPSEKALDTREIQSQLLLSTLSEQSNLSPVSVTLLVEYSLQAAITSIPLDPIFFSGKVMGERAMKTTKDVGSLVVFTIQVHILGKPLGHLGNLEVEFDWPKEVANGKWLLYLTEIRLDGTSNPRCIHEDNINPLNLLMSDEQKMKRSLKMDKEEKKRNQEGKTLPVLGFKKQRKTLKLSCISGARCVKFSCPLLNVTNVATLTMRSRLWNSTMIEDYSNVSSVSVQGLATLKLRTTKSTISMKSSPSVIQVHIYPESGLLQDSGAPLWIIVVSVLAGVLLLALICLLLWKCGFFKRASTRELYEAKNQRALMRSQPSDKYKLTEEL